MHFSSDKTEKSIFVNNKKLRNVLKIFIRKTRESLKAKYIDIVSTMKNDVACKATTISNIAIVLASMLLQSWYFDFSFAQAESFNANPGEIIINEIMQNPSGTESQREWFEFYNKTEHSIDLNNCFIRGTYTTESHTIKSSKGTTIIPSRGYLVLAINGDTDKNGGISPDYVYGLYQFYLGNGADKIILSCDDVEIDKVEYDGGVTFPDPDGASMILGDPGLDNNVGSSWCVSSSAFGAGDKGTPGAKNDDCGMNSMIWGYKYGDVNNNGVIDEGENKLGGWEIKLGGDKSESLVTDESGYYSFSVPVGNYTIEETQQEGWAKTYPESIHSVSTTNSNQNLGPYNFLNYKIPPVPPNPVCGNDILETGEECDGSNGLGEHQACSNSCKIETLPYCGDNMKNGNEECDNIDGVGENQACSNDCTLENLLYCGDGIINGNEQCDGISGIGLNQACSSECSIINLDYCGDGVKNGNEECDGNDGIEQNKSCSASCSIIQLPFCGDGAINQENESCDDGNLVNGDGCSSLCLSEPNKSTISGYKYKDSDKNGNIDAGDAKLGGWKIILEKFLGESFVKIAESITSELSGNLGYYEFSGLNSGKYKVSESFVGKDNWIQTYPLSSGYHEMEVLASSVYENVNFANYEKYCGNNIKDEWEQCDGSSGIGQHETCSISCAIITLPYCGDTIKNTDEQCDDGNLANGDGCSSECKTENSGFQSGQTQNYSGDGISNGGGGGSVPIIPFAISDESIKITRLLDQSVTISWQTNNFSTSQIIYSNEKETHLLNLADVAGIPPKYGYARTTLEFDVSNKVTSHSITIYGLDPGMKYFYRTISRGSFDISDEHEFTTDLSSGSAETQKLVDNRMDINYTENRSIARKCDYLTGFAWIGKVNNANEVIKIEMFLNDFEGESLEQDGIYEIADYDAISKFQRKYTNDVLSVWNINQPTGNVYISTRKKINEVYCGKSISYTESELNEIEAAKNRLAIQVESLTDNTDAASNNLLAPENPPADSKTEIKNENESLSTENGIVKGESTQNTSVFEEENAQDPAAPGKSVFMEYSSTLDYLAMMIIFLVAIYRYKNYIKK